MEFSESLVDMQISDVYAEELSGQGGPPAKVLRRESRSLEDSTVSSLSDCQLGTNNVDRSWVLLAEYSESEANKSGGCQGGNLQSDSKDARIDDDDESRNAQTQTSHTTEVPINGGALYDNQSGANPPPEVTLYAVDKAVGDLQELVDDNGNGDINALPIVDDLLPFLDTANPELHHKTIYTLLQEYVKDPASLLRLGMFLTPDLTSHLIAKGEYFTNVGSSDKLLAMLKGDPTEFFILLGKAMSKIEKASTTDDASEPMMEFNSQEVSTILEHDQGPLNNITENACGKTANIPHTGNTSTKIPGQSAVIIPNQIQLGMGQLDLNTESQSVIEPSQNNPEAGVGQITAPQPSTSSCCVERGICEKMAGIYKKLEPAIGKAPSKIAKCNAKQDSKKVVRELGKLGFNEVYDDYEILEGTVSGRVESGSQNELPTKALDPDKSVGIARFVAWSKSNRGKFTLKEFKIYAGKLKETETGLEEAEYIHFYDRIMVKYASDKRRKLKLKRSQGKPVAPKNKKKNCRL